MRTERLAAVAALVAALVLAGNRPSAIAASVAESAPVAPAPVAAPAARAEGAAVAGSGTVLRFARSGAEPREIDLATLRAACGEQVVAVDDP